jgi:hypothetical protein
VYNHTNKQPGFEKMNAETDSVEVKDFNFNGFDLLPLELLRHVFLNLWSPADFANVRGTCRLWKSLIADSKMDRDPLQFNSSVLQSFLADFDIPMSEVMSAWRVYYVPNRIAVVASSIDMKTGAPKGHGYVLLLEQNAAIYAVWDGFTTCDNVISYVLIDSRLVRGHVSITIDYINLGDKQHQTKACSISAQKQHKPVAQLARLSNELAEQAAFKDY